MSQKDTRAFGKRHVAMTALCVFLGLILIAMIFVTAVVEDKLNKIGYVDPNQESSMSPEQYASFLLENSETGTRDPNRESLHPTDVTLPTATDYIPTGENIVNIMLVGQDRRPGEGDYNTRSDAMILVTVNKSHRTITLTSFMRDLYVAIPGYGHNKMNTAFAVGGMNLLGSTMQTNFGIQVDKFVAVDFSGFQQIVEAMGGVDMELTEEEANHLNARYGFSLKGGMNHLNGEETLNYARIRYLGMDFERTNRQRKVLNSMLNSCKDMSLGEMSRLLDAFLPLVSTNMERNQITSLAMELFPLLSRASIVNQRIPIDGSYDLTYVGDMDVVLGDLEKNRQFLETTLNPKD